MPKVYRRNRSRTDGVPRAETGFGTCQARRQHFVPRRSDALQIERNRLHNVLTRAECVLWEGIVREIPAPPDHAGELFDTPSRTILKWDIETLNDAEAFARVPIARHHPGQTFSTALYNARLPDISPTGPNVPRALREARTSETRQSVWVYEWRVRLESAQNGVLGDVRWLREAVQAQYNPETAVWDLVGVLTDITDQKRNEAVLRDSERKLAEAQRMAGLGYWELTLAKSTPDDPHGMRNGTIEWSDQIYQMYGRPRSFTPTMDAIAVQFAPEEVALITREMTHTVESGLPFRFEHTVIRPDGTRVILAASGSAMRDDQTGCIVKLAGTGIDVTAQKRQLQANAELMAELRESGARMKQITRRARCLIWEADVREQWAHENQYLARNEGIWSYLHPTTGETVELQIFRDMGETGTILDWHLHTLDEEIARTWLPVAILSDLVTGIEETAFAHSWYWARPDEDRLRADAHTHGVLRRMTDTDATSGSYSQDFRVRMQDGSLRWLHEEVDIECLSHGDESTLQRWRLVGVCTDITAQKEIEAALFRSNQELSDFASVASHDLQEPLRKIQTLGDMLKRKAGDKLDASSAQYLERMQGAAGRMQTLITDLLSYSRVTTGAKAFEPLDLARVFAGVCEDLETRIERTGGRIVLETPLPTLCADALQMRQLLQNLLGNALKYHRDGVPPVVSVTWTDEPQGGVLSVRDNGMGFEPKYAERVFQVFERLEGRASGREGTGVGLAIVRKIAERHGGQAWCESEPGVGSVFYVRLG